LGRNYFMAYEYHCRQRVEFADTDMAGIVHFANFFRYMERAEHEFLRALGLSVHAVNGDDVVSWPRVNAECKYRVPLSFEDELDVHLLVREKRSKSVTYEFRFYREGDENGEGLGTRDSGLGSGDAGPGTRDRRVIAQGIPSPAANPEPPGPSPQPLSSSPQPVAPSPFPEVAAVGSITVVCVSIDRTSGRMTPIPIPESIDRLIEVAPAEVFEDAITK